MRLAISNIAWLPGENEEVAAVLNSCGVDAIEAAPTLLFDNPLYPTASAVVAVRRFWEERGIEIVALQSLLFGAGHFNLFGEKGQRREMLEYLKGIARLGGELGAKILVFGSPKNRIAAPLSREEAFDIAAEFFRSLGTAAADAGTCLCIEPNAPEYGCDFVTDVAEGMELVEMVDHPGFGLHVDGGVMTLNGEPSNETIMGALPLMRHFHISEPFLNPIIEGRTAHAELSDALGNAGYEGCISIEMRKGSGPSNVPMVEECVRYALANYMRKADATC